MEGRDPRSSRAQPLWLTPCRGLLEGRVSGLSQAPFHHRPEHAALSWGTHTRESKCQRVWHQTNEKDVFRGAPLDAAVAPARRSLLRGHRQGQRKETCRVLPFPRPAPRAPSGRSRAPRQGCSGGLHTSPFHRLSRSFGLLHLHPPEAPGTPGNDR